MKNAEFPQPEKSGSLNRRTFIKQSILAGTSILVFSHCAGEQEETVVPGTVIPQAGILGGLKETEGPRYLPEAKWYEGNAAGDGLSFTFPTGSLANERYITTDMLADGNHMIRFQIELQEGEEGPAFRFEYGVLNQCSLRVRMPLSLVDQNRWGIEREGAFLKPRCGGDRVDLAKVDRMKLIILRKSHQPAKFCLTPVKSSAEEVPVISHPVSPKGKLIDDIGQSTIHDWPLKTKNADEMVNYLQGRFDATCRITCRTQCRNGVAGKRKGWARGPDFSGLITMVNGGGLSTHRVIFSGLQAWTASGWIPLLIITCSKMYFPGSLQLKVIMPTFSAIEMNIHRSIILPPISSVPLALKGGGKNGAPWRLMN
jgi:hypothetical protein